MPGHADGVRRKLVSLQEGLAKRKKNLRVLQKPKKCRKLSIRAQLNAESYQGSAKCRRLCRKLLGLIVMQKLSGLSWMKETLNAQLNAGNFQGPAKCRKLSGLSWMQESLRAQLNAGNFQGSAECRKLFPGLSWMQGVIRAQLNAGNCHGSAECRKLSGLSWMK